MKYSISDLEQLSGVQTHTIRIWERRYAALEPLRSAGNTRYYDDYQLKRLLNIVSLNQSGLKISEVCALSEDQMRQLLSKEMDLTRSGNEQYEFAISQLLSFGLDYNEFGFDGLLSKCIHNYGMTEAYVKIIYPLLVRLGLMWRIDHICPAQEHFLSCIIRQKIFSAIDELPLTTSSNPVWLLFLPEDEDHDIGLLFANYILRLNGQKVIYLGNKVPLESIKEVLSHNAIHYMLLFMVRSRPVGEANAYLEELSLIFNHKIHIAGNSKLLSEIEFRKNVNWFKSASELELAIKKIRNVN